MITDSSASSDPTADTSSDTLPTSTGTALTGRPIGGFAAWPAGGAAGLAASAFCPSAFCSGFCPAVAPFLELHPAASSAAVTSAVRMATLRMIGVCTCLPLNSGRWRETAGFDWWRKNIASGDFPLACDRRGGCFLVRGDPLGAYFAYRRVIYFSTS